MYEYLYKLAESDITLFATLSFKMQTTFPKIIKECG